MTTNTELQIQFASHTILGKEKKYNTDICESFDLIGGIGIVVCDGVDGSNNEGGALAAKLAIEGVKRHFRRNPIKNPIKALQGAMMLANFSVYDHAMKNERFVKMGVNILLVTIVNDLLYYASIGSNALVFQREGVLYQLIKPSQDEQSTTVLLGMEKYTRFSICKNPIQVINGDVILCASDGLSTIFSDQQIAELLHQDDISIDLLSYQIIFKLEELHTADNATVALARLTDKSKLPSEMEIGRSAILDLNNPLELNQVSPEDISYENCDNNQYETKIKEENDSNSRTKTSFKNKRMIIVFVLVLLSSIILIMSLNFFLNSGDNDDALVKKQTEKPKDPIQKIKNNSDTKETGQIKSNESEVVNEKKHIQQQFYEHKVQKGENLYRISKKYNISSEHIKKANSLKSDELRFDQKIKIPIKGIHTVIQGESVASIASLYKLKTQDILKVNQITNEKQLKVGTKLIIPLAEN